MKTNDKQYKCKAQFNPNRETYVDGDGNYVYVVWDAETKSYRREVCVVGEGGFSPELRSVLDEMDAEEERYLDADWHHTDMVFEGRKKAFDEDTSGRIPNPIECIPQPRQRTFQDAIQENPQIALVLKAMEKLTPEQVDLIYATYGELKFGADIAREQGVSRQAVNNRLKKIHTRLEKLLADMDKA